jgi:hypothetical protein
LKKEFKSRCSTNGAGVEPAFKLLEKSKERVEIREEMD